VLKTNDHFASYKYFVSFIGSSLVKIVRQLFIELISIFSDINTLIVSNSVLENKIHLKIWNSTKDCNDAFTYVTFSDRYDGCFTSFWIFCRNQ